eukprot:SAG25_NODE_4929_length_730_cov_0.855784_1_plen_65_part_10
MLEHIEEEAVPLFCTVREAVRKKQVAVGEALVLSVPVRQYPIGNSGFTIIVLHITPEVWAVWVFE